MKVSISEKRETVACTPLYMILYNNISSFFFHLVFWSRMRFLQLLFHITMIPVAQRKGDSLENSEYICWLFGNRLAAMLSQLSQWVKCSTILFGLSVLFSSYGKLAYKQVIYKFHSTINIYYEFRGKKTITKYTLACRELGVCRSAFDTRHVVESRYWYTKRSDAVWGTKKKTSAINFDFGDYLMRYICHTFEG